MHGSRFLCSTSRRSAIIRSGSMLTHRSNIRKYTRAALAGGMSVWLSGIVFLFCCQAMNARADIESCPLAKMSHHCDKAGSKSESPHSVDMPPVNCFNGCGFMPAVFDKSRKVEEGRSQLAVSDSPVVIAAVIPEGWVHKAAAPWQYRVFVPPERIFIRNCTFRI